jgi:dTDP-4-dehydrorhamnose reductase
VRLAVTGRSGQVVSALAEAASKDITVIAVGRPELDLSDPATVGPALRQVRPDIIVSAAAYTAVDKAEGDEARAFAVNALGAGAIAEAAAVMNIPVIHLSTDYVYDGLKPAPYIEADPVAPLCAYGRTKLAGERRVAACPDHVILRTAWVYGPHGANFVRTMLRLAETRDIVRVVADQIGNPTSSLDIAEGILRVAQNLTDRPTDTGLRGIFHLAGAGEASWADLAEAVLSAYAARAGRAIRVERITTAEYPTPARRPANSRLDTSRLAAIHGVAAEDWRLSLGIVLGRLGIVDVTGEQGR